MPFSFSYARRLLAMTSAFFVSDLLLDFICVLTFSREKQEKLWLSLGPIWVRKECVGHAKHSKTLHKLLLRLSAECQTATRAEPIAQNRMDRVKFQAQLETGLYASITHTHAHTRKILCIHI